MTKRRLRLAAVAALALAPAGACAGEPGRRAGAPVARPDWQAMRAELVEGLRRAGIRDPRVLEAVARVPRHEFVPEASRALAYQDTALPIASGQTISQPYIVAAMLEAARVQPADNVLEVGTGSGYHAAVTAELLGLGPGAAPGDPRGRLASIEILPELGRSARATLERLGYGAVELRVGDGYLGWPERAPFDAIVVTAAPDHVPQPLLDQLAPGGRLVIPVGRHDQMLRVLTRTPDGIRDQELLPVRFVPLTREH